MRNLFKIFLLSLCVLALSSTPIHSNNGADLQKAAEVNRIQPASVDDLTYLVLVWTGSNLFPSYFPQFEFEAGNSLLVTAASSNWTELTGIWTEVEFGDLFSYFTAQVEQEEITTTTVSIPSEESGKQAANPVQPLGTKMIDLWGISFSIAIPPPFSVGLSILLGGGTYLGKNALFSGITGIDTTGTPAFGSISPSSGAQGATISDVEISGINTEFEKGVQSITFIPPNDITITNIVVQDDTHVQFDLDIGEFAEAGERTVVVIYDIIKQITSDSGDGFTITTGTTATTTVAP